MPAAGQLLPCSHTTTSSSTLCGWMVAQETAQQAGPHQLKTFGSAASNMSRSWPRASTSWDTTSVRQLATSSVMPACTQGQGRQGLGQGGGGARGRARGRAALVWHHLAMSPLPDEQISSTAATTSSSNNPPHAYAQVAFAPPPSLRTRFRPQQLACARTAVLVRCGQLLPHRWPCHHAKGASRKLQPIYGMAHPLQKLSQVGWGHGSVVSPPACRHMLTAGKPRVGGECAGRPPGSGYHPAGPLPT